MFLKGGVLTVTGGKKPNGKNVAAFEDGSELTIEDGYAYYDGTKTYECGEYDNLSEERRLHHYRRSGLVLPPITLWGKYLIK